MRQSSEPAGVEVGSPRLLRRHWLAGILVLIVLLWWIGFNAPLWLVPRPVPPEAVRRGETVVLLHGMGRTRASMSLLGRRFYQEGYDVFLFGYNPRAETLDELSLRLKDYLSDRVQTETYHLVGHSLGNIIIRNGLQWSYRPGLGRIVMIAPPNGPAEMASVLKDSTLYQFWTGDSGQKLADASFYETLPIPDVDFGVIAGDAGPLVAFDEPNDGVVRVANTRLEAMVDWVVVPRTHTFIMMAPETFAYCHRFLQTGRFTDEQVSRRQGHRRQDLGVLVGTRGS